MRAADVRLARIDFTAIPSPIVLRGGPQQAHRDPCGHYHDGVFRVWHSSIRGAADSNWTAATAVTQSRDLNHLERAARRDPARPGAQLLQPRERDPLP